MILHSRAARHAGIDLPRIARARHPAHPRVRTLRNSCEKDYTGATSTPPSVARLAQAHTSIHRSLDRGDDGRRRGGRQGRSWQDDLTTGGTQPVMERTERRASVGLVIQGVLLAAFGAIAITPPANALDNGLALTPVRPPPARCHSIQTMAANASASASVSEAMPSSAWCLVGFHC